MDVFNGTDYLNPAAFAKSPLTPNGTPLRLGTAPRFLPMVRGPASLNETFRMSKKFPLKEKAFFQIGMSVINPFNRTVPTSLTPRSETRPLDKCLKVPTKTPRCFLGVPGAELSKSTRASSFRKDAE